MRRWPKAAEGGKRLQGKMGGQGRRGCGSGTGVSQGGAGSDGGKQKVIRCGKARVKLLNSNN